MGHGTWNTDDWSRYAAGSIHGRDREMLFTARTMKAAFDPAQVTVRESCDSNDNPQATPIIIGVDVTGSMGLLAEELVVRGLNATFTQLIDKRPIPDPHVMAMAIGDATCDAAPLQVTQFEADLRIVEQLRGLWLEGGGGGNDGESYSLAHVFAGLKTVHDAWARRGRKGFLFTVGDEPVLDGVARRDLDRVLDVRPLRGISGREAVQLASETYEVFHLIVDGSYAARQMARVRRSWEAILPPERVIYLGDPSKMADTIVATIERHAARAEADVAPRRSRQLPPVFEQPGL